MNSTSTHDILPATTAPVLHEAEVRFKRFLSIAAGTLVVLLLLIFTEQPSFGFWIGKGFLSVGSFLILASLIHARYFDVSKNIGTQNQSMVAVESAAWIQTAESMLSYGRFAGFLLLIASRWTIY